ncbi:MAG TPA: VOC family protein, partial [Terriglobales bacterium]
RGGIITLDFELGGLRFTALNGGPQYSFTPAVSFMITCQTQAEVDHYWARNAGAAPLAPWAKSARKAAKITQCRPAPGKQRGADPTGLGLKGSPARSSVKRVEWRSHSGSRANQMTEGGKEIACGWLEDKFGLSWQVVPEPIFELLRHPKAMQAMLAMKKLDLAVLQAAARD